MIRMRQSQVTNAFCCGMIAAVLIGSARADELCEDVTTLVGLAEHGFDQEEGSKLTVLSGATDCGLGDNLDGTRSYHCMWQYPYRHHEAYDQFERMTQLLRTCFAGSAKELRDQPVNHPDFYDQISYRLKGVNVAVSIKDKSALQSTFTFIRIHTGNSG